jgi:hypothetical protein
VRGFVNTTSLTGTGIPFLLIGSDNATTVAAGAGSVNTLYSARDVLSVNSSAGTIEQSRNQATLNSPATVTSLTGYGAQIVTNAGSTATTVVSNSSTQVLNGTVTNAYGVRLSQSGTGAVANSTLLELGSQVGTNKRAIWQTDTTSNSYFAGRIGIGNTAATNNLHIGVPLVAGTTGIRTLITSAGAVGTSTAYLAVDNNGDIVRGAAPVSAAINYTSSQNNSAAFALTSKTITYRSNAAAATVTLPACTLGDWTTFIQTGASVVTYSANVQSGATITTAYTGPFNHQLVCANSGTWTKIN